MGLKQVLAPHDPVDGDSPVPIAALQERIEKELQENPVLEVKDTSPIDQPENGESLENEAAADAAAAVVASDDKFNLTRSLTTTPRIPVQSWNSNDSRRWIATGMALQRGRASSQSSALTNSATASSTRCKTLLSGRNHYRITWPKNSRTVIFRGTIGPLALHVISFIDRIGYVGRRNEKDDFLPVSLLEIASTFDPPTTPECVERVLHIVQHLDPPGVGARDLRECLLLQIEDETPQRDLVRKIILEHLEDVAHNRLPVIQKKTGADLEHIREALEVLKHLNPKPGNQFSSEGTRYVTPDVIIEKNEDGEYDIRLTDDWAPRLRIPKHHYLMYKNRDTDPATREYLKKKLQSAEWLKDAIEQRRNTLERVTRAIVAKQKPFLDQGPEAIEPLKMQQIADQVGVHVTTVSRAVDDKWVMTPRGVFPLKRFFVGAATNKETGEMIPWEKVKSALMDMVNHEDKNNPLSDEELESKLQATGFPVKRRTVTKYRKLLSIPSSRGAELGHGYVSRTVGAVICERSMAVSKLSPRSSPRPCPRSHLSASAVDAGSPGRGSSHTSRNSSGCSIRWQRIRFAGQDFVADRCQAFAEHFADMYG